MIEKIHEWSLNAGNLLKRNVLGIYINLRSGDSWLLRQGVTRDSDQVHTKLILAGLSFNQMKNLA